MDDFEAGHAADGEERRQREVWQAEMEEGRAQLAARGQLRRAIAGAGAQVLQGFVAEQRAAIAELTEKMRPAGAVVETVCLVLRYVTGAAELETPLEVWGVFAGPDDARNELGIRAVGTWNEERTRYTQPGSYFDLQTMRVQRFGA